ncbi:hypothetical protein [Microbulbifer agarilyticus]|uniref:hypothetical protein n=1 Tax=Microbulbifer agarilyticus TaxID=260552 RepID=UPI0012FA53F7|nr:hypothetical protein [Microbulbifer agarilyticus]
MSNPKQHIPCTKCGNSATPVYNGRLLLRGWLCTRCEYWDRAIGRERKLQKSMADKP